jgi:hypothetical protein
MGSAQVKVIARPRHPIIPLKEQALLRRARRLVQSADPTCSKRGTRAREDAAGRTRAIRQPVAKSGFRARD